MITLRKIKNLERRTQLRRLGGVFHLVSKGEECPSLDSYFAYFLSLLPEDRKREAEHAYSKGRLDDLYYLAIDLLGEAVADWDLKYSLNVEGRKETKFPISLYLDGIRSPYNVGSIFRSAECFGVERIYLRPGAADPFHERAVRTSMGTIDDVSHLYAELDEVEEGNVFALELGGEDISSFKFPKSGICIVGSEEDGVSKEGREMAERSLGIVSIPLYGKKGSLNVSQSVSILLYMWSSALVGM